MRYRVVILFALGLTATLHRGTAEAADLNDFIDFSGSLPGRLYVPPEAADLASPRPLVLILHGGTCAGTDNQQHIISCGIDALVPVAKERGAFLYAPQSPTGWNNGGWRSSTEIMTMIDQVIDQENVDPDRLYVTGLSTGGGGTWDMLNHVDDRFAAAMPISTATLSPLDPANLLGTPTWAFHSRNDNPGSVRRIINDMLTAAGEPTPTFPLTSDATTTFEYENERLQLKYTEGATGGQYIWDSVWSTTEVMDWMFSQTLSPTPLESISLSGGDGTYVQDFDAALGSDGTTVGATFPAAWTKDGNPLVTRTTTPFPVGASINRNSTFNAGAENDADRALAVGVQGVSDQHFLQLLGEVTGADANLFQLKFDVEAWDARDGIEIPGQIIGGPDVPGEAAFHVALEVDSGDGYAPLADFGTVTTGRTLQPVVGGIVDGNADANRISFDSGMVPAPIPVGSSFRVRWTANTEADTVGWVFGLDNVVISLMSGIVEGDVNEDGFVDVTDLDTLIAAIRGETSDLIFDVDQSGDVDAADRDYWIKEIKRTIDGDVDFDGSVNSSDLNALGLNWRSTTATSWSDGDFNGDGNVDSTDLNTIGLNWRKVAAAQTSTAPVPEPSTLQLSILCLLLAWRRSRERWPQ